MNMNENYEKYIESLSSEVQEKFRSAESAEEIKALIEEYDVELPLDALENIAEGFGMHDPGWFLKKRFKFTPNDIKRVKEVFGVELQAEKVYTRGDLNSLLGLNCSNDAKMRDKLILSPHFPHHTLSKTPQPPTVRKVVHQNPACCT